MIPRVGMEMVVEFLEGDPDQPLVTGCVYNGRNTVPYELPEHKTRSTFRSKTHQESRDKFNELRFEDERGREEIYLRAEKDLSVRVRDNKVERVSGVSVRSVDKAEIQYGSASRSVTIASDYSIKVGDIADHRNFLGLHAFGDDRLQTAIAPFSGLSVAAPSKGDFTLRAAGAIRQMSSSSYLMKSSVSLRALAREDVELDAGRDLDFSALRNFDIKARRNGTLSAGKTIHINVGRAQLIFTEDGIIRIQGDGLQLRASGDVSIEAGNAS